MASAIKTSFGEGGANVAPAASGEPTLAAALRDCADDLAELRAQLVALLAKLDTDFTAQNLAVAGSQLDENYASTLAPASLKLTKG